MATSPIGASDQARARRWLPELRAALRGQHPDEFPGVTAREQTARALATTKAVR